MSSAKELGIDPTKISRTEEELDADLKFLQDELDALFEADEMGIDSSNNEVFTKEDVDAILPEIQDELDALFGGTDETTIASVDAPEGVAFAATGSPWLSGQLLGRLGKISEMLIESEFFEFEAYVKEMVRLVGARLKPYMKQLYLWMYFAPGYNNTGMTDPGEVGSADIDEILKQEEEREMKPEQTKTIRVKTPPRRPPEDPLLAYLDRPMSRLMVEAAVEARREALEARGASLEELEVGVRQAEHQAREELAYERTRRPRKLTREEMILASPYSVIDGPGPFPPSGGTNK